jgi:hypothetical protein
MPSLTAKKQALAAGIFAHSSQRFFGYIHSYTSTEKRHMEKEMSPAETQDSAQAKSSGMDRRKFVSLTAYRGTWFFYCAETRAGRQGLHCAKR